MKEKFIVFLRKHSALRKFKYNIVHVRLDDTFETFIEAGIDSFIIERAFVWDETREDHDYWCKLSDLWEEEYKKES